MCVCTLRSSGTASRDRASSRSTTSCASLERQLARQLHVQRQLVARRELHHAHVVDLAHVRHAERGGGGALAQVALGVARLHVDDHVGAAAAPLDRVLDVVGDRVRLGDAGVRRRRPTTRSAK